MKFKTKYNQVEVKINKIWQVYFNAAIGTKMSFVNFHFSDFKPLNKGIVLLIWGSCIMMSQRNFAKSYQIYTARLFPETWECMHTRRHTRKYVNVCNLSHMQNHSIFTFFYYYYIYIFFCALKPQVKFISKIYKGQSPEI